MPARTGGSSSARASSAHASVERAVRAPVSAVALAATVAVNLLGR
ncbi:hypothetical protein FHR75_002776 [Kineococcus radiotolerans]|uniref:Uncharacterized protein n=1 Tax=Kineococcus radiotolerans TaxID=131568 RepID=A0A7W4TPA7_KINRA|nr:hypothetical protein [Kineococcus radiotolerans]MBB2901961.1 hypothetical protein [Kineococcus radiotolerans]